jgi:hypothetical protein
MRLPKVSTWQGDTVKTCAKQVDHEYEKSLTIHRVTIESVSSFVRKTKALAFLLITACIAITLRGKLSSG